MSKFISNPSISAVGEKVGQTQILYRKVCGLGLPISQWLYNLIPTYQFRSSFTTCIKSFQIHGWVFKLTCQLQKESLKGLANVQEVFSYTISLVIDLQQTC